MELLVLVKTKKEKGKTKNEKNTLNVKFSWKLLMMFSNAHCCCFDDYILF